MAVAPPPPPYDITPTPPPGGSTQPIINSRLFICRRPVNQKPQKVLITAEKISEGVGVGGGGGGIGPRGRGFHNISCNIEDSSSSSTSSSFSYLMETRGPTKVLVYAVPGQVKIWSAEDLVKVLDLLQVSCPGLHWSRLLQGFAGSGL